MPGAIDENKVFDLLVEMCENGEIASFLVTPECRDLMDGWDPRATPDERLAVVFPDISDNLHAKIFDCLMKYLPELTYSGMSYTLRVSIILAVIFHVLDSYLSKRWEH